MAISVKKLVAMLNGICERFDLDPGKTKVLLDGVNSRMTFVSIQMNDDGAMLEQFDDEDQPVGMEWADRDGCPDELYRCLWISIKQGD